jgi:predicted transposase YdaD
MLSVEWNQEDFYQTGKEEGREEGLGEGIQIGENKYIESRVQLWKNKMSVDEMSDLLSISPAEVEAIIQKLQ